MAELEPEKDERGGRVPGRTVAAAGAAALLGALAFSRARRRAQLASHQAALRALAEEYGCEFVGAEPGSPRGRDFPAMTGSHRGRQVRIETEVGDRALRHRLFTTTTAGHTAPVEGFVVVRRETVLTRVADSLGLMDVQVGEPAFDDRFEVASDLPDAACLLQPEVRDALMGAQFESVVLRAREVAVRQEGPVGDLGDLRQALKLAIDIAEWLETLS